MRNINGAAAHVLVTQSGLIKSAQLRASGVGRRGRAELTQASSQQLDITFKSVFGTSGSPLEFGDVLVALTIAYKGSFITGTTLGRKEGLRRMPQVSEIQLSVPHGLRTDVPPGVRLRQSRRIEDALDVRVLPSGLRVASWPRLAFDLASELPPPSLRSVIEQMLHNDWVTMDDLEAMADRLCHPNRPGSRAFRAALDARGRRDPVESGGEFLVLEGLLARGVPVVPQYRITLPDGRPARFDLAVPEIRWAVEIDLHPSHAEDGGAGDKRRDRSSHLADWQVERVSEDEMTDVDALCDELAMLYQVRRLTRPT